MRKEQRKNMVQYGDIRTSPSYPSWPGQGICLSLGGPVYETWPHKEI